MHFGQYYAILGLIFQGALIVFAIRAYRSSRTRASLFIMGAAICYVIAASSWWTFYFSAGLVLGRQHLSPQVRHALADSRYYSDQTFQLLFVVLMIAALICFTRGSNRGGDPNI
jgi:ABC-type cobalamin transport system permease subunit